MIHIRLRPDIPPRPPAARPAGSALAPALAILALLAGPAPAQQSGQPLTGAEFESYVEGRTLYYGSGGQAYGIEQYFEDRRVRWSFLNGECQDGRWYEDQSNICFVYEYNPGDAQCWQFFLDEGGLTARFLGDDSGLELYQVENAPQPMSCQAPYLGA